MHLTVEIPIPKLEISKNGSHGHWRTQQANFQAAKTDAYNAIVSAMNCSDSQPSWVSTPWKGPVVVCAYWSVKRKPFPDYDNLVARLAPAMDAAQAAGLFENDRQIKAIIAECFRATEYDPCVELTFYLFDDRRWVRAKTAVMEALAAAEQEKSTSYT